MGKMRALLPFLLKRMPDMPKWRRDDSFAVSLKPRLALNGFKQASRRIQRGDIALLNSAGNFIEPTNLSRFQIWLGKIVLRKNDFKLHFHCELASSKPA